MRPCPWTRNPPAPRPSPCKDTYALSRLVWPNPQRGSYFSPAGMRPMLTWRGWVSNSFWRS